MVYHLFFLFFLFFFFFFSSRRRHTRCSRDWSSDVCSSDLIALARGGRWLEEQGHPVLVVASSSGFLGRFCGNRGHFCDTVGGSFGVPPVFRTSGYETYATGCPRGGVRCGSVGFTKSRSSACCVSRS